MSRGKYLNVALICTETGTSNYVIRVKDRETLKGFGKMKKYCPRLRRRTEHDLKIIKGGY